MNRGTCLDMCNFTKWFVHLCMDVCMCTVRVCGMYQPVLEWTYCKNNVLFLSLLFDFVTTSIASAWSGLGAGLLYKQCKVCFGTRSVKKSKQIIQMNLCKWLFDNVASLICQLCLFKQTLPCRATQSIESTDSTDEIKISVFSLCDGTQVWLQSA